MVVATKPDNLSLIPRIYMGEGEEKLRTSVHTDTHTKIIINRTGDCVYRHDFSYRPS